MIEVAARLGGVTMPSWRLALGVDLNGLALEAALGERSRSAALQPSPRVGGAFVRFLVPPEGVLAGGRGLEEARAVEGVQDVRVYRGRPRLRPVPPRRRPRRRRARDGRHPRGGPRAGRRGCTAHTLQGRCRKSRLTEQKTMLSFQPPAIGDEEIEAVAETLRSGWLTTGPRAAELERRFAEYAGPSTCSRSRRARRPCTSRLSRVGIGPGDEVITSPITWPAPRTSSCTPARRRSSGTCATPT